MTHSKDYYINRYVPAQFRQYITNFYKDEDGWWVELDPDNPCHFDDMIGSGSQITQHEYTLKDIVDVVRESLREGYCDDCYRRSVAETEPAETEQEDVADDIAAREHFEEIAFALIRKGYDLTADPQATKSEDLIPFSINLDDMDDFFGEKCRCNIDGSDMILHLSFSADACSFAFQPDTLTCETERAPLIEDGSQIAILLFSPSANNRVMLKGTCHSNGSQMPIIKIAR